jgi:glycosyltransferase involved in cell wall biosynthesis
VTHHLANYENKKWGTVARAILRLGEYAGMSFANARIAVSAGLAARMQQTYRVSLSVIPNGVHPPRRLQSTVTLDAFDLQPGRYVLMVARIDDQKCQLDLIKAFARAGSPWKLAIAGGADYSTAYARAVVQAASETPGVVMLGHQTGDALAELYSHAGIFVLPSSHEGQPIAALEALSYGCSAILSDIPAHREIGTSDVQFVPAGDIAGLAELLAETFHKPVDRQLHAAERERLIERHDWQKIARQTLGVYTSVVLKRRRFV